MTDPEPLRERSALAMALTAIATAGFVLFAFLVVLWLLIGIVARVSGAFTDEGITDGIYAQNRTNEDLRFRVRLADDWFEVPGVAEPYGGASASNLLIAGRSVLDADGCVPGPILAVGAGGREVARLDGPVCVGEDGQELWVIGSAGDEPSD